MMSTPSVVVVGGGVLGASIAAALAERSARVTLLDSAVPGGGVSAASFAQVNAQRKEPESYFRLNSDGLDAYHRLLADGVGVGWFHPVGTVEIATDPASSAALVANVAGLRARGYRAELITARRAAELEPVIDPARVTDAAHFGAEGWIDTDRMIADRLGRLRAAGGEIRAHCAVAGFEQVGARTKVVLATGEELAADRAVCAVGAATQGLLSPSGVEVPMIGELDRRVRGPGDERYVAVGGLAETSPLPVGLRRIVQTPDLGLRPSASGRVVLRGDGAGSRVPRTDPRVFHFGHSLLDRARSAFPAFADVSVERLRMGVRSLPADGRTVAGFADAVPGLYVVATHSGVTLAAHLARLIAGELLGEQRSLALADFRPGRFPTPVSSSPTPGKG